MLNKLNFSVEINAYKRDIWNALWTDEDYRAWAGVFFKGSYIVKKGWKKGGKVHFLDPDQNGIYSLIEQYIPDQLIQFKHIGSVVKGEEQPVDDDTRKWSGATELYKINDGQEMNALYVELDVLEEHLDFMKEKFPIALDVIKKNSLAI